MTKARNALICCAVFIGGSLAAAPAIAQYTQSQIMYERYYYSDASHTEQVGYEADRCTRYGVGGSPTDGIETAYYDSFPYAYCVDGEIYPY
jgi:hypothetical protein